MGAWIETYQAIKNRLLSVVAPHVGAWIETWSLCRCLHLQTSLPMWERGLKQHLETDEVLHHHVAPHVGAWIETPLMWTFCSHASVAPHVGAWIETKKENDIKNPEMVSLPMWERGLKPLALILMLY